MYFDDRLATVLRHRATGEHAARTQFRQLLDLLGAKTGGKTTENPNRRSASQLAAAWLRLNALGKMISSADRAAMVHDPALRLRNAELITYLAESEPDVAAAAIMKADLSDDDWATLIPRLPIRARGFLRFRRDLSPPTENILERLGIQDRGLPVPMALPIAANKDTEPSTKQISVNKPAAGSRLGNAPSDTSLEENSSIAALVKRIEAFRKAQAKTKNSAAASSKANSEAGSDSPPRDDDAQALAVERNSAKAANTLVASFSFTTDTNGRIDWASQAVAPAMIGMLLPNTATRPILAKAMLRRQVLRGIPLQLIGSPRIDGDWIIDANPRFTQAGGNFFGYAGLIRRSSETETAQADTAQSSEADRLRQLLHELRTPVNAIQGFSEVIQQQLFGPTPHEYRALAASIAGDSARMLAGFDELDRLARLETGALEIEPGVADFGAIVARQVNQLQDVLKQRTAGMKFIQQTLPSIGITADEAETIAWRLLATLATTTGAGEHLLIKLRAQDGMLQLACELPLSLETKSDIFTSSIKPKPGALSAGMFGAGFSLRLVRAEVRAIGGELKRADDWLMLNVPHLTAERHTYSESISS